MLQIIIYTCIICICLYVSTKCSKKLKLAEFFVFLIALFVVTLINREADATHQVNLIPLKELFYWLPRCYRAYGFWGIFQPIGGLYLNILLFVPFGWLLLDRIRVKNIILLAFILSLAIELLQLITGRGMFETDDLITNTLGALIGCMLYQKYSKSKNA